MGNMAGNEHPLSFFFFCFAGFRDEMNDGGYFVETCQSEDQLCKSSMRRGKAVWLELQACLYFHPMFFFPFSLYYLLF